MTDETIFAAALEQSGRPGRTEYLDRVCGIDTAQRKRIDALLEAHDKAGTFLARPAVAPPEPSTAPTRAFHDPARTAGDDTATRTHGGVTEDDAQDALGFLAPSTRPDSLGKIGRYEILEVLGHGGFGIVYRAFDDSLQRVVSVKVLAPSLATTSPARKRFLREAQSAASIRHENVVRIHEIGEQPLPHLVMEFIPGETLQQRLDRTGPVDVREVVQVGRQVAEGLAAAHANGLIHRDIKPSNILIDSGPELRVKITDFGLARAADDASLTRSGTVAGTPLYMAPEQARGESLDHRADLFSLGSVLYVMCTGRPPFRAETTLAVLKRVAEEDPRPIREIIPETPGWLCRIIEKLHAKTPDDRYQTAQEVADVLADCEKQLAEHRELKNFARIPGGKPRACSNRLRILVSFGVPLLLFALLAFAVWAGPFTVLYPNNQGRITLAGPPDPDLQKIVVLREGGVVATLDHSLSLVKLPPGEYELEAVCVDGYEATKFHVESRLLQTLSGAFERVNGRPAIRINLRRGESIEVSATPEKRPVSPPSPEQIAREEASRLNGDWIVRQASVDRAPVADSDLIEMKLTLQDGTFTLPIRDDHGYPWALTGTYAADAARKRLVFEFKGQDAPIPCTYQMKGDTLTLDFPEPKRGDRETGSTTPFVPDVRRATQQNLYTLGIAMHNFVDQNNTALPPPAIVKNGKPLLSWRVALLPFLDQDRLYRQFKLDEPWDSEHNRKLIDKMPKVFSIPGLKTPPGQTHYRVFVGPGTAFEPQPGGTTGVRFLDVKDALANTILVAEAAEPVIWTRPDELPYDPQKPLPRLGVYPSGAHWLMGDGSVVRPLPGITEQHIRAAIVRNDDNAAPSDLLQNFPYHGPAVQLELRRHTEPVLSPQDREDLKKLQGEWTGRTAQMDGLPVPPEKGREFEVRLGDRTFEFRVENTRMELYSGTFQIEAAKKQLLLYTPGQKVPIRVGYRLDDDRLRLDFAGLRDSDGKKDPPLRLYERFNSQNYLKQLAIAMHGYADASRSLPPAGLTNPRNKDDKLLLSWRVAILPYLNHEDLYKQFKLHEPWDSEHNKKLIPKMPKLFAAPGIQTPESGLTHYRVFVGPGTAFEARPNPERGIAFNEFADGTARTLLVVEAAEPTIWTKPDDLPFDPKKPLPKLGVYERAIHVAFADASVAALAPNVADDVLRGLITRNGGETVSAPVLSPEPFQAAPLMLELQRGRIMPPGAVLLRALDPAKDKPVPLRGDASTIVRVDNGAWRIENNNDGGNFRVALATLTENIPADGILIFRAKVKLEPRHKAAAGSLELTNASPSYYEYDWPGHLGEYRGAITEWTEKEVRYPAEVFHQKKLPAIPVYVGLHADGVLWVKDAEILHIPAKTAPVPPKPNPPPPSDPAVVKALQDAVAAKARARDQVKTRAQIGVANPIDLLQAEAEVADARIKLAEAENDAPTVLRQLEELVKFRQQERDLIAVRVEAGADRREVLDRADARLAEAQSRLAKVMPARKP